jgi:hypothetical protein
VIRFEIPLVEQAGYEIDIVSVGDDNKGLRAEHAGVPTYHG